MNNVLAKTSSLIVGFLFIVSPPSAKSSPHHETCLKAADYEGCIKVMTHGVSPAEGDAVTKLRSAMKQVASRLSSGTSLRDSSSVFQPVVDAHAVVPANQHNSLAYQAAAMAIEIFDATQAVWQSRISGASYDSYFGHYQTASACKAYKSMVKIAALKTGNPSAFSWDYSKKGLLGVYCKASQYPETPSYRYTIGVLRDGSTDPKEIADYTAKLAEAKRLAALGPWQRYLDKNPDVVQWVKANPALAEKRQAEYIKKNGSDPVAMPSLPSSMKYLKGTKVEKYL